MTFPILSEQDLPPINTSCERSDIDFKNGQAPKPSIEHAKDIAALANTIGGSIIIGAETNGTIVVGYPGIADVVASELPNAFEQSASERCRPVPKVVCQVIRRVGRQPLVVVNVWPSPLAPVGVSIHGQQIKGAELMEKAWAFPVRVGSQTPYLAPDQFGSLESVSARRSAALLLSIPSEQRGQIKVIWSRPNGGPIVGKPYTVHSLTGSLSDVVPSENVVHFSIGSRDGEKGPLALPLDWIDTVWRDQQAAEWVVQTSAVIEKDEVGRPNYRPHRPA